MTEEKIHGYPQEKGLRIDICSWGREIFTNEISHQLNYLVMRVHV